MPLDIIPLFFVIISIFFVNVSTITQRAHGFLSNHMLSVS